MQSDNFLSINDIYYGNAVELIKKIAPETVSLSFWSPPYFVGKDYEKGETYDSWQLMLKKVISGHFNAIKKGGFLVVNIDDILAYPDVNMPKIQAPNKSKLRSPVTKEMILAVKAEHPDLNRNELAKILGCSEQTIDRRLNGNNIRGGNTQPKQK
ncbi:DNA methyltransferase [Brenneria salicis]|uniref:DNA methylase n=1 Tax=Brenneria salicis ATCC 15712 = DSM 30166 TaxID=714314 RepID=A0A366HY39_9GAMM|nr:DNA methyltransferase [Brenneria salicis]RBP57171.1 DNA methylase [Brenneria salicis ATCC 15712 = DSM 30166]